MSIQPGRVVARMVDEVTRAPRSELPHRAFGAACFAAPAASGELLEVVRLPLASGGAPFASLFHFWIHALRAFLDRRDEVDQLAGIAGYGMCDAVAASDFCGDLAAQAARLAEPWRSDLVLPVEGRIREAYRMIDGDCRRSGVAAAEDEWLAWFWVHGCCGHRVHVPVETVAANPPPQPMRR